MAEPYTAASSRWPRKMSCPTVMFSSAFARSMMRHAASVGNAEKPGGSSRGFCGDSCAPGGAPFTGSVTCAPTGMGSRRGDLLNGSTATGEPHPDTIQRLLHVPREHVHTTVRDQLGAPGPLIGAGGAAAPVVVAVLGLHP